MTPVPVFFFDLDGGYAGRGDGWPRWSCMPSYKVIAPLLLKPYRPGHLGLDYS